MVVYIDIVFMLALFQNSCLLIAAGVSMKEKIKVCRIILGGLVGAIYQLICVLCSVRWVLLSVFVAFLQVSAAYSSNRLKITCMFIAEALVTAGIMYAMDNIYSGILFVLCQIVLPYAVSQIRHSLYLSKLNTNLEIKAGERKISVRGFVDSGNSVNAIIIGKSHAVKILGKEKTEAMLSLKEGRYSTIPCTTVNGSALLPVFTADSVKVNGKSFNTKIGVMQGNLPYALLPVDFLETGDMDDKGTNTEAETVILQKALLYRRQSDLACPVEQGR